MSAQTQRKPKVDPAERLARNLAVLELSPAMAALVEVRRRGWNLWAYALCWLRLGSVRLERPRRSTIRMKP